MDSYISLMLSIPLNPFLYFLLQKLKSTFNSTSNETQHEDQEQANNDPFQFPFYESTDYVPPPVGTAPRRVPLQGPFLNTRSAARRAEAEERNAPVGINLDLPSSQPPRGRRGRSIPTTRRDADQGARERRPTTRQQADQDGTSEAQPTEPWDLIRPLFHPEAPTEPSGQPTLSGGTREYHRPSTSNRPVTGRVTDTLIRELGLDAGTAFQRLMMDRTLGNRESRGRRLNVELDEMRARSETRLLGRRGQSRWENLSSTFKMFVVWAAEVLRGPDFQAINAAWKITWWVEAKIHAKQIELPTARKYVKNLTQSCQELGLPVETEVTAAYKESLARDGALRAGHQAPPAEKTDVTQAASFMTLTEYLGLRLAWKTASRIGEMRHLMKHHFVNVSGRLWAITFPFHKGDPYRLGTCIVVNLDELTHKDLVDRLAWVPDGASVTDLTTTRAAAVLGAVRPGLTAHSIKRGALVTMLRAGVPLQLIQVIAKHKDLETLMVYLPRAEVAMAMGLQNATECL